jgi:hypothetical protein
VFADTRGQARAMFTTEHNLEFIDKMSIRRVASDVNRVKGVAACDDILQIYACPSSWADGSFDEVANNIMMMKDYPASWKD